MKKNAKHLKPILNMIGFVLLGLLLTLTTKTSALAVMAQIDAGGYNTVGLKSDGTAKAVGDNRYGQRDVDSWNDIVQVTVGAGHTVGLKSDGTVMAVGYNAQGQCDVDSWTDIIQVSAGWIHTVGLKSNGSVITAGCGGWNYGQCDVSDWKLIVTDKSLVYTPVMPCRIVDTRKAGGDDWGLNRKGFSSVRRQ